MNPRLSKEMLVHDLGKIGSFKPWYAQPLPNEVHGLPKGCLILNGRKTEESFIFLQSNSGLVHERMMFYVQKHPF